MNGTNLSKSEFPRVFIPFLAGLMVIALPTTEPFGAQTTELSNQQSNATRVTISGSYAYWVDWNLASIYRASLSGGGVQTLYSSPSGRFALITSLAVGDGYIFWTEEDFNGTTGDTTSISVYKLPTDGGQASSLLTISSPSGQGLPQLHGLALVNHTLYYIIGGSIYAIDVADGNNTLVAPIASSSPLPWELVADGSHLYWYDAATGGIGKVNLSDGSYSMLVQSLASSSDYWKTRPASSPTDGTGILIAGGYVYWGDVYSDQSGQPSIYMNNESLYRVPLTGGPAQMIFSALASSCCAQIGGMTYDPYTNSILFTSGLPGMRGIFDVPVTGGVPQQLWKGIATDLFLYGTSLVYSTGTGVYVTSSLFPCSYCYYS